MRELTRDELVSLPVGTHVVLKGGIPYLPTAQETKEASVSMRAYKLLSDMGFGLKKKKKRSIFWPLIRRSELSGEDEILSYYHDMARLMGIFLFGCLLVMIAFGLRWMAYQ